MIYIRDDIRYAVERKYVGLKGGFRSSSADVLCGVVIYDGRRAYCVE